MKDSRFVQIASGVLLAVWKRSLYVVALLVIIQLIILQASLNMAQQRDNDTATQATRDAQQRLTTALKALEKSQATSDAKTQRYIRCIAEVLLRPLGERSASDFNACGIPVDDTASSGSSQESTPAATTAPAQDSTSRRQTPTTSAPPEAPSQPQTPSQPSTPPASRPGPITRLVEPITSATDRVLKGVGNLLGGKR